MVGERWRVKSQELLHLGETIAAGEDKVKTPAETKARKDVLRDLELCVSTTITSKPRACTVLAPPN